MTSLIFTPSSDSNVPDHERRRPLGGLDGYSMGTSHSFVLGSIFLLFSFLVAPSSGILLGPHLLESVPFVIEAFPSSGFLFSKSNSSISGNVSFSTWKSDLNIIEAAVIVCPTRISRLLQQANATERCSSTLWVQWECIPECSRRVSSTDQVNMDYTFSPEQPQLFSVFLLNCFSHQERPQMTFFFDGHLTIKNGLNQLDLGTSPVAQGLTWLLGMSVVFFIVLLAMQSYYDWHPALLMLLFFFFWDIIDLGLISGYFWQASLTGALNSSLAFAIRSFYFIPFVSFYGLISLPLTVYYIFRVCPFILEKMEGFKYGKSIGFLIFPFLLLPALFSSIAIALEDPSFVYELSVNPIFVIVSIPFWSIAILLLLLETVVRFVPNRNLITPLHSLFFRATVPVGIKVFYYFLSCYFLIIPGLFNAVLPLVWEESRQYLWISFCTIYGGVFFLLLTHFGLLLLFNPEHGKHPFARTTKSFTGVIVSTHQNQTAAVADDDSGLHQSDIEPSVLAV